MQVHTRRTKGRRWFPTSSTKMSSGRRRGWSTRSASVSSKTLGCSTKKSLKEKPVLHLIYFYPKADTPGCTAQACGLRDIAPQIGDTVVVGISPDKPAKQAKFDTKYSLGFPLLADEDHAVAEAYDVWKE